MLFCYYLLCTSTLIVMSTLVCWALWDGVCVCACVSVCDTHTHTHTVRRSLTPSQTFFDPSAVGYHPHSAGQHKGVCVRARVLCVCE